MANKTAQRKVQSKIVPSEYVNNETGEALSSEVGKGISITIKEDTNQFIINSDDYVVFDSQALHYLQNYISKSDVSRVMTLAAMLKGDCSVICKENNHPHTPESLHAKLDVTLNEWYIIVRRLCKRNVLSYCVCAPSGYVQKIYMLNPYIARKRKTINCELNHFFRDVTKDGEIED